MCKRESPISQVLCHIASASLSLVKVDVVGYVVISEEIYSCRRTCYHELIWKKHLANAIKLRNSARNLPGLLWWALHPVRRLFIIERIVADTDTEEKTMWRQRQSLERWSKSREVRSRYHLKKKGRILPQSLWKHCDLADNLILNFCHPALEKINFCCYKTLNSWHFVIAAL